MKSYLILALALAAFLLPASTARNRLTEVLAPSVSTYQEAGKSQDPSRPSATPDIPAEVVRVETDLVTTLFTAIDRDHHFITNLRAEDVRIMENGVEQEITLFERETDRPLTIVVLVDTSRSQERTLPEEKKAAKRFVDAVVRLDKDTIAVVGFTGRPKLEAPLSSDVTAVNRAIDRLEVQLPAEGCDADIPVAEDPRCWTSIWDSVLASTDRLLAPTRRNARRAIILLTDGDDTSSKIERDDAIQAAIKNDVVVYGIGIGDPELYSLKKKDLTKIAEKTGGRAFFPREDLELGAAFAQIQDEMRSQYVIAYSPRNKARDGSYRKVKLEVVTEGQRKNRIQLLHRQGYYAKQN